MGRGYSGVGARGRTLQSLGMRRGGWAVVAVFVCGEVVWLWLRYTSDISTVLLKIKVHFDFEVVICQ